MRPLASQIRPSSPEFAANRARMQSLVDDLHRAGIAYVVVDDGMRSRNFVPFLNEPLFGEALGGLGEHLGLRPLLMDRREALAAFLALSLAVEGWLRGKLPLWRRALLLVATLCLAMPDTGWRLAGAALLGMVALPALRSRDGGLAAQASELWDHL